MKLFNKPKDERIEAEMGKIYKVGFWIMGVIILFDLYVGVSAQQFTGGRAFPTLELLAVLAGFLYVCIQMVRKGIFDDDLRYAETDVFPKRYCLKLSILGALGAGAMLLGGRIYNEIIYEGLAHVTWVADIVSFVFFVAFVFFLIYLAEYIGWRAAKKRRDRSSE